MIGLKSTTIECFEVISTNESPATLFTRIGFLLDFCRIKDHYLILVPIHQVQSNNHKIKMDSNAKNQRKNKRIICRKLLASSSNFSNELKRIQSALSM